MKEKISEQDARKLTGYCRSSLLKKRQKGLLNFERDIKTGRIFYDPEQLKELCGQTV